MKYDQAGTYEIRYKAIDECGNETTATRTVEVVQDETKEILLTATNVTLPFGNPTPGDYTLFDTVSQGDKIQLTLKGVTIVGEQGTGTVNELVLTDVVKDFGGDDLWGGVFIDTPEGIGGYALYVTMLFDGNIVGLNFGDDAGVSETPSLFTVDELIIERI